MPLRRRTAPHCGQASRLAPRRAPSRLRRDGGEDGREADFPGDEIERLNGDVRALVFPGCLEKANATLEWRVALPSHFGIPGQWCSRIPIRAMIPQMFPIDNGDL